MLARTMFRVLLLIVVGLTVFVCAMVFAKSRHVSYTTALVIGFAIASGVLFTLGVVVGASFVGAEWNSGSMGTLLTWEPRRSRVLLAQLAACIVTVMAVALAVLVLIALLLLPSAAAHGTVHGVPWWTLTGVWVRIGITAAIGAALGVGIASFMRSAAGAIATWLIFQFVASPALIVWKRWLVRWLPDGIVREFVSLEGVIRATVNGVPFTVGGNVLRGGLVLALYAGTMLVAGYSAFRGRDVT
jgi:ABC-type transport system involved in multi-copper enzyme maturation permease subunit